MFQGLLKVERSHSTICIFRRFHRLFRDVLRPSRFYRFQVWCLGNGWCFQMCWLENFCRWSYSSFSEDLALGHFFFDTNSRSWWRKSNPWVLETQDWWLFTDGVGLVEFLWLKKNPPKTLTTGHQGADVLCFVELDCYHECGIQVIFRRHSKWICLICFQPRFKEILGADGYDVGIPRAFPGSGGSPGMDDGTTGRRQTTWIFGSKRGRVPSTSWKAGWLWHLLATRGGKKSVETFQHCASERTPTFNCVIDEIPSIYSIPSFLFISSMLLIQQAWILSQIHLTCYRKYLSETFVFTGPGVQSCLEAEWSFFDEAGRRSHESDFWGWTMSCLDLCTLLEILLDTLW